MKIFLPFFVLVMLFTSTSCEKDDVLPPNTGIGKNTFGCLVNGKLLVARRTSMFQMVEETSANLYQKDGKWLLSIGGTDYKESPYRSVDLYLYYDEIQEGGTYRVQGLQERVASATYRDDYHDYNTNGLLGGEIKVSTMDRDKRIISGTFWFDAVKAGGQNVEVRDGRFDIKY